MKIVESAIKKMVFIRLNPGDDILLCLKQAVKDAKVENAVVLSGVGSVTSHHFHVVSSCVNPPREIYPKAEEVPADIVNINGFIINGRVHAHIIYSNDKIAYGGHLEEGTKVLTFTAITLGVVDENFDKWDSIGKIETLLS